MDAPSGYKVHWNEASIAVPINVNYGFAIGDILKISPYLGPTIQFGITSKEKFEYDGETEEMNMYDEDNEYSRLNILIGGGVAFDIASIVRVSVGYDFGLLNRSKEDVDGGKITIKDRGLHLGVAYLF